MRRHTLYVVWTKIEGFTTQFRIELPNWACWLTVWWQHYRISHGVCLGLIIILLIWHGINYSMIFYKIECMINFSILSLIDTCLLLFLLLLPLVNIIDEYDIKVLLLDWKDPLVLRLFLDGSVEPFQLEQIVCIADISRLKYTKNFFIHHSSFWQHKIYLQNLMITSQKFLETIALFIQFIIFVLFLFS